jgi:hypothetical protein
MKHNTATILHSIKPVALTPKEQDLAWEHVRTNMTRSATSRKAPAYSNIFKKSLALTLIFGITAGTAFAADNAKPGDTLFPIDRALENLQLSIAPVTKQNELKMKFALERVSEVKDVLEEVAVNKTATEIKASDSEETPNTKSVSDTEKNTVVVSHTKTITQSTDSQPAANEKDSLTTNPEYHKDDKSVATSGVGSTTVVATGTALSVDKMLALEAELQETASELSESDISASDKKRIEVALGTALSFLGDIKSELDDQGNTYAVEYIDLMLEELNQQIEGLPSQVAFEIDLSAQQERVKFEVTSTQGNKPKVQIALEQKAVVEEETTNSDEKDEVVEKPREKKQTSAKLQIKNGDITITKESDDTTTQKSLATQKTATTSTTGLPELPPTETSATTTSTSTKTLNEKDTPKDSEDGTTTVKVIFKRLDEDFEISVQDQNATIHDIIKEYTESTEKHSTSTIDLQ